MPPQQGCSGLGAQPAQVRLVTWLPARMQGLHAGAPSRCHLAHLLPRLHVGTLLFRKNLLLECPASLTQAWRNQTLRRSRITWHQKEGQATGLTVQRSLALG